MYSPNDMFDMKISRRDRTILRELATRYRELCESERNRRLIADWRRLNNLQPCRPMIHANCGLLGDEIAASLPSPQLENERLHHLERFFNQSLLWDATLGDDRVFYPWLTMHAPRLRHPEGPWGVANNRVHDKASRGWRNLPVLETMDDLAKLKATEHRVLGPNPLVETVEEAIGDILPMTVCGEPDRVKRWVQIAREEIK